MHVFVLVVVARLFPTTRAFFCARCVRHTRRLFALWSKQHGAVAALAEKGSTKTQLVQHRSLTKKKTTTNATTQEICPERLEP